MPTLDWLNREAAFRLAARVPTRLLRPHPAGHRQGDAAARPGPAANGAGRPTGNLLVQGDNLDQHAKVRHWIRNLDSDPDNGFWLPTDAGRSTPTSCAS